MTALFFLPDKRRPDRWHAFQPDGEHIGRIQRSRFQDDFPGIGARYFEARMDANHEPRRTHSHQGYAPDPAGAMHLLVSGWAYRFGQPS